MRTILEWRGATKRAQSTSPEKQPPKKLKADTSLRGFTERSNPGNGDCLFGRSHKVWNMQAPVAKRLCNAEQHVLHTSPSMLRLTVGHWDGCHPQQGDHVMQERKFEQYLEEVGKPQAWGSAA